MNRRVRGPYARWCESLSLSAKAGRAGYSMCALNGEYKGSFNGKDNQRVKVSYARSNDPKH